MFPFHLHEFLGHLIQIHCFNTGLYKNVQNKTVKIVPPFHCSLWSLWLHHSCRTSHFSLQASDERKRFKNCFYQTKVPVTDLEVPYLHAHFADFLTQRFVKRVWAGANHSHAGSFVGQVGSHLHTCRVNSHDYYVYLQNKVPQWNHKLTLSH